MCYDSPSRDSLEREVRARGASSSSPIFFRSHELLSRLPRGLLGHPERCGRRQRPSRVRGCSEAWDPEYAGRKQCERAPNTRLPRGHTSALNKGCHWLATRAPVLVASELGLQERISASKRLQTSLRCIILPGSPRGQDGRAAHPGLFCSLFCRPNSLGHPCARPALVSK